MKERFIAQQLEDARVVIGNLLELSCWFEMTPFPDDKYEIVTKAEGNLACAGVSMDRIELLSIHKPCSAFLWDVQVRQDGKWLSIYGPFEDIEDAEDVVDEGIKRAKTSNAFRIIPLPNALDQATASKKTS